MAEPRAGYRRCTRCQKNRQLKFFKPRGRICFTCQGKRTARTSRADRILDTYGITEAEYDLMLAAQGGVCYITGTKPYGKAHLDIDHDHQLQKKLLAEGVPPQEAARRSVRGLLSKAANRRLLTAVRDDVTKLQRAIDYLNDPPARRVLGTA